MPDPRLAALAAIGKSQKIVPTSLEFVDIAGLVRGASKGEGLGNQFLANIREVDAIIHVLRCFEDSDVTHVEGSVDPIRDAETVETELMLADLESSGKARARAWSSAPAAGTRTPSRQMAMHRPDPGSPARRADGRALAIAPADAEAVAKQLQLLTSASPCSMSANVEEGACRHRQ